MIRGAQRHYGIWGFTLEVSWGEYQSFIARILYHYSSLACGMGREHLAASANTPASLGAHYRG